MAARLGYAGAMSGLVRREEITGGVRFVCDAGRIDLTAPMASVIVVSITGDVTEELGQQLREAMSEFVRAHAPAELFLDQLEARSVPTPFRKSMLGLLSKMTNQLTRFHVLSQNTLLPMLVATANLVLHNRLQSYAERGPFEAAMRRANRRVAS
jgi:hypothetical protein